MILETKFNIDDVLYFLEGSAAFKGTVTGISINYTIESTIIKYTLSTLRGLQIRDEDVLTTKIDELTKDM